jgi:hypothetical protein
LETQITFDSYINQLKKTGITLKIYLLNICLVLWLIFSTIGHQSLSALAMILLIGVLPVVSAAPTHSPFSDITFQEFSTFIEHNFSLGISLATVLVVLFTTTSNPDLLNLYAQQQNPLIDETVQVVSGWMKTLA